MKEKFAFKENKLEEIARASNEQFKETIEKVRYENNELENMLHELREKVQTKETHIKGNIHLK